MEEQSVMSLLTAMHISKMGDTVLNKTKAQEKWKIYEFGNFTFIVTSKQNLYVYRYTELHPELMKPVKLALKLSRREYIDFIYGACGSYFIVTNYSNVYAFGRNNVGQLGFETKQHIIWKPSKLNLNLEDKERIKFIYSNEGSTFIVTNKSGVFAFGWNENGKLGFSALYKIIWTPKRIQLEQKRDEKITLIYCNNIETFIVTNNNNIYTFGLKGHLGMIVTTRNGFQTKYNLRLSSSAESIKSISGLENAIYIVTNHSNIYSMGYNIKGELGIGFINEEFIEPAKIDINLKGETIKSIFTFDHSTFFLTDQSTIYACGLNDKGQLGITSTKSIILTPVKMELKLTPNEEIKGIQLNDSTLTIKSNKSIYNSGTLFI